MKICEAFVGGEFIKFTSGEIELSPIAVSENVKLCRILTLGQKIVISSPQILVYNEGISQHSFIPEYHSLFEATVNENFVNNKMTLLFYNDNKIFRMFDGEKIGIKSTANGIIVFQVDDFSVVSIGLKYMVIGKRKGEEE